MINQELELIKISEWTKNWRDHTSKDIRLEISRIETETRIEDASLTTDISIYDDSEIIYNSLQQFFKVHYSISWNKKTFFDIDRKTRKYESYYQNTLFCFVDVKVNFVKETKGKIKARIKRLIEKWIKEDMKFYQGQYVTKEKPGIYDYLDSSKLREEILIK